jgi:acetoacetyl-CoA synthetase
MPGEIPSYDPLPFDHPLYVMYSSGTTGKPKCIIHGHGGTLLQHLKEHQLHTDLRPGQKLFYFTTTGWMMWNWLVTALASGSTVVLFDGNPFHPGPETLWKIVDEEKVDVFGTSAKFIDACKKAEYKPGAELGLDNLRAILSTGSPLVPESFDYVYEYVKSDLQLSSISGGTDIVSCFVLGCPVLPVRRGEIQTPGLGMAVEVWNDEGKPLVGEPGELVCTKPFPSMPVGFWNDPDQARYRAAYFEHFSGIWRHGDWVELTENLGTIVYGRSDATLNPGGVRIGTAEIYRQVEQFPEILEAIVVGQDTGDGDQRVVLFLRLADGITLEDDLCNRVRKRIRTNATPRHVPAIIHPVSDIPRTRSGKISEIAVRDVLHGKPVKNTEALANPESLDYFRPELIC